MTDLEKYKAKVFDMKIDLRSMNLKVIQDYEKLCDDLLELVKVVEYYANGNHFHEQGGSNYSDDGKECPCYFYPENPSGESINYLEGHGDYGFEDGTFAKLVLSKLKLGRG